MDDNLRKQALILWLSRIVLTPDVTQPNSNLDTLLATIGKSMDSVLTSFLQSYFDEKKKSLQAQMDILSKQQSSLNIAPVLDVQVTALKD